MDIKPFSSPVILWVLPELLQKEPVIIPYCRERWFRGLNDTLKSIFNKRYQIHGVNSLSSAYFAAVFSWKPGYHSAVHHVASSWTQVCRGVFLWAMLTVTFIPFCSLRCLGNNTYQTQESVFIEVSPEFINNRSSFLWHIIHTVGFLYGSIICSPKFVRIPVT